MSPISDLYSDAVYTTVQDPTGSYCQCSQLDAFQPFCMQSYGAQQLSYSAFSLSACQRTAHYGARIQEGKHATVINYTLVCFVLNHELALAV